MRKILLTVLFVCVIATAPAQQQTSSSDAKPQTVVGSPNDWSQYDSNALIRERDSLTTEIEMLNSYIYSLNDAASRRHEFEKAKAERKPTDDLEKGIEDDLKAAQFPGLPYTEIEKQRDIKKQAVLEKQQRKSLIDAELIHRADVVGPQQKFKLNMSLLFAGLVGLVILGFFVIALRDEQVRREIFSGQSGIQFVTLFSLVIAIILFGIIDVLEGKELAALLGGLSGYILGRSTSSTKQSALASPDGPGKGAGG